jgi:hypothetical protein
VRRTASGTAGNGLGNTAKYLRRTRNGAAGNGHGTTAKYMRQTTAAGSSLATTIKYLRGAAGIGLNTTTKYCAECLCVDFELPPCVHKQNPHQHTFPFASAAQINISTSKNKTKQASRMSVPSSPPSLRLKEPQATPASLASTTREATSLTGFLAQPRPRALAQIISFPVLANMVLKIEF